MVKPKLYKDRYSFQVPRYYRVLKKQPREFYTAEDIYDSYFYPSGLKRQKLPQFWVVWGPTVKNSIFRRRTPSEFEKTLYQYKMMNLW